MAKQTKTDFLAYYHQYKDKIYTYLWYRVGFNKELAEDLTSEIFIKALKNFDSFDQARPFQAWIYKIAQNHLINHYKVADRESGLTEALRLPDDLAHKVAIEFELEQALAAMHRLNGYHREVLLLRFVEGLTNDEIADVLDKEPGAVRTQISRALDELRQKLTATK